MTRGGDGGVRVGGGRLRVDAARAVTKLREYQLPDPTLWTLEVVRAAVLLGATAIHIEADADDVWIGWEGPPLAAADLTRLFDDLVGGGDERRGQRLLAVGVNTALALAPRFADVWSINPAQSHRARYGAHLLRASEDGISDALRALIAEPLPRPEWLLTVAHGGAVHVRRPHGLDVVRRALTGDVPPEVHRVLAAANALTIPVHARPRPAPPPPALVRIPIGVGERSHMRGHAEITPAGRGQGPAQLVWSELGVILAQSPIALGPLRIDARIPIVVQIDHPRLPTNAARSAVREGEPLVEEGIRESVAIVRELVRTLATQIEAASASGDGGRHHALRAAAIAIVDAMLPSEAWMEAVKAVRPDAIHAPLLDVPVARNALGEPRTLRQLAAQGLDVVHGGPAPVRPELAPWLSGVPWAPPGDPLRRLYGDRGPKDAATLVAHAEQRAEARLRYLSRPETDVHFPVDEQALASATFTTTSVLDAEKTWLPDDALSAAGIVGRVVVGIDDGNAPPRGDIVVLALRRQLTRVVVPSEVPFRAMVTAPTVLPDAAHRDVADRDALAPLVVATSWAAVAAVEHLASSVGDTEHESAARPPGTLTTSLGPAARRVDRLVLERTVRGAQRLAVRLAHENGRGADAIAAMVTRPTSLSTAPVFRPWPDGPPSSLRELQRRAQVEQAIGWAEPPASELVAPIKGAAIAGRTVIVAERTAGPALPHLLGAVRDEAPTRKRRKRGAPPAPRLHQVHVVPYGELSWKRHAQHDELLRALRAPEVVLLHEAPGVRAVVALERPGNAARAHLFHAGRPIEAARPLPDAHVPLVIVADDDHLVPTPDWKDLAVPERHATDLLDAEVWCQRLSSVLADRVLGRPVTGLLELGTSNALLFVRLAALAPDGAESHPALTDRIGLLRAAAILPRLGGGDIAVAQLLLAGGGDLPFVPVAAARGVSAPVPPELTALVLDEPDAIAVARFFRARAVDRSEALAAWQRAQRRERAWSSFMARPSGPLPDLGPGAVAVSGAEIVSGTARAAERHRARLRITTRGRLIDERHGDLAGLPLEAHVDVEPTLVDLDPVALTDAGLTRIKGALRDAARRILLQAMDDEPARLARDEAIAMLALVFVGELPPRRSGPAAELIGKMLDARAFPTAGGELASLRSMIREGDEIWCTRALQSWLPPSPGARPHALDRAPLLSLPEETAVSAWVELARMLTRQLGSMRDVTKDARRLAEARSVARGEGGRVTLPSWVPRAFAVPLATLAQRSADGDALSETFPQGEAALAAHETTRLVLVGPRGETVLSYAFVPPVMIVARSPLSAELEEPEARQRVEDAVRTVVAETLRWTIDEVPHGDWPAEIKRAVRHAALLGGRTHIERIATAAVFGTTAGRYVSYEALRDQVNRFGALWVVTSPDVTLEPLDPLRFALVVAEHERAPLGELLPIEDGSRELALDDTARRNLARPSVESIEPTAEEIEGALGVGRIDIEGGEAWVMPLKPHRSAQRGLGAYVAKKPLGAVADPCRWPTLTRIDSTALTPDRVHGAPEDDAALDRIGAQVRAACESIVSKAVEALHAQLAPRLLPGEPRYDVDDDVSFATFGAGAVEVRGRLTLAAAGDEPEVQAFAASGGRVLALTATAPKSLLPTSVPLTGVLLSSAFDLTTVPSTQLDAMARRAYVALLGAAAKSWKNDALPAEARELALATLVRGAIDRHIGALNGRWMNEALPMLRRGASTLKELTAAVRDGAPLFSLAPGELGAIGELPEAAVVVVRDDSLPSRVAHAMLGDRLLSLRAWVTDEPEPTPEPAPPVRSAERDAKPSAKKPRPVPPSDDGARRMLGRIGSLVRATAGAGVSLRLEERRGEPMLRRDGTLVGVAERHPILRALGDTPAAWADAAPVIAAEAIATAEAMDEQEAVAALLTAWAEG